MPVGRRRGGRCRRCDRRSGVSGHRSTRPTPMATWCGMRIGRVCAGSIGIGAGRGATPLATRRWICCVCGVGGVARWRPAGPMTRPICSSTPISGSTVIADGVLVPAEACRRWGPTIDLLVRSQARRDGIVVDADLDQLLRELVQVGLERRGDVEVTARMRRDASSTPEPVPVWRRCSGCDRPTDGKLRRGRCDRCYTAWRRGNTGGNTATLSA